MEEIAYIVGCFINDAAMCFLVSFLVCLSLSAPMTVRDTVVLDGGTYIGRMPSGEGRLYHDENGLFIGSFNRGVPSGPGIRVKPDGSLYSGNFVNGLCQGYGRLFMATGAVVCGEFSHGHANGLDTLYYPDGRVFIGIMANNGPTRQGKTYKSAAAAGTVKPGRPAVDLDDADRAFLERIGIGAYDSPAVFKDGSSFFQVYIHPNFRFKESIGPPVDKGTVVAEGDKIGVFVEKAKDLGMLPLSREGTAEEGEGLSVFGIRRMMAVDSEVLDQILPGEGVEAVIEGGRGLAEKIGGGCVGVDWHDRSEEPEDGDCD